MLVFRATIQLADKKARTFMTRTTYEQKASKHTERQTEKHAERHTERQTETHAKRQTERRKEKHARAQKAKSNQQETFRVIQSLRQSNHKHEESTRGKHRNNDLGFESYSNCDLSVPIAKPGDGQSASSVNAVA